VPYAFGKHSYPSGLVAGRNGVLYLTGTDLNLEDGIVFRLTPPAQPGAAWAETVVYDLNLAWTSGVVLGPKDVLYGALTSGTPLYGAVYELFPPSAKGGLWTETVIYAFTLTNGGGAYPNGYLTLGPNGVIL